MMTAAAFHFNAAGIKPPMAGPKPCRKKRDGYRGLMFDKFPWFLM